MTEVVDNPADQGRFKRLVHPDVNGAAGMEFFVGLFRMEPGEYHPLHYHPNGAEFYYVLAGSGDFRVGDEWVAGQPGLTLYFPPFTRHAVRATGTVPLEILYGFNPPDLEAVGMIWEE